VISWYPPEQADKEGKPFDSLFPMFLDTAEKYNLKIAFHIEPYRDRNPGNFKNNVEYIIKQYGNHPAIYKLSRSSSSRALPVFYVYDSYLNTANSWSIVLSKTGKESIRNTEFDGVFLGLVVEMRHKYVFIL
jgi:glycoprotein endo-alpha-1,2-mannosidase